MKSKLIHKFTKNFLIIHNFWDWNKFCYFVTHNGLPHDTGFQREFGSHVLTCLMKNGLLTLIVAYGALGTAVAAVPGPKSNFDANALITSPQVNNESCQGLKTRGILYFDMANDVGTLDRLREMCALSRSTGEMSHVIAVAEVLASSPDAVGTVRRWLSEHKADAHRADMALLLADLLLESGYNTEAIEAYNEIAIDALSPDLRDDYLYHLGYADLVAGKYTEAMSTFENQELLKSSRYGNAARFYQGYVCYINRDYSRALELWDNVNPYTMPGRRADYYRAQIAYLNGRYDEALRLVRPLLADNGAGVDALFTAEAYRIAGESYYQKGDNAGAIPYLKKYVAMVDSPERSALYVLGIAQYDEGDYEAAIKSLTPVTTDAGNVMGQSAYLYIGQALLKTGDDAGAILAFNRALTMNMDSEVTEAAYYNYAVAKSRGAGVPFASSVIIFEDFLSKFPESKYADDVASYIVTGCLTDGNYEAALSSIEKVKNPSPAILGAKQKVLYMLGARALANNKPSEAVALLNRSLELAKYDAGTAAETKLVLGEAHYRTGEYDKSVELLNSYLAATGTTANNRAVALYDLGYAEMALENWSEAENVFEKLLDAPGSLTEITLADVQSRLGDARYYQRKWKEASVAYDASFTLYPEGGDYPLLQKAVMQGYNRDYKGKLATIERFEELFPGSAIMPDALMEKAEAYIQLRQPDKADLVYRTLAEYYGTTGQGRNAYLYLAANRASSGKTAEAIETYQQLIAMAPTSEEARLADEAVKRLHAEQGTLDEYARFLKELEGAPEMDSTQSETLAWNAAEHAFLSGKGTTLLERYTEDYPTGRHTARAMVYLMEETSNNGDENETYRWATLLTERFPDNSNVQKALALKADIEYGHGRGMEALRTWQTLEAGATEAEYRNQARYGMMRVARDTGDAPMMLETAEALLNSTTLGAEERTEAAFTRALALNLSGDKDGAVAAWKELATNPDEIYGAKSAVYAAETLLEEGKYSEALAVAEKFVNSGTPHNYWLARGFIVLSDAYAGEGNTFQANEYIKALRDNYPGSEPDILDMIEQRLK